MRLTFVLPFAGLAGGVRVVAILANRLCARGHEVTVISTPRRPPGWRAQVRDALRLPWETLVRPAGRPQEPSPHMRDAAFRHVVLERDRPVRDPDVPDGDAVIATWWATAAPVAALSPSKGRKFYFVQHHEVHAHIDAAQSSATYRLPLKKIVVSSWLRDIMAEVYGDRDVALVPNSVDLSQFNAEPRGRGQPPTVGYMYSSKAFKGADLACEAIRLVRRARPDLRIVALAPEPPTEAVPVADGAILHHRPPQERLRDVYAACDVWMMPSRAEGFGLPLIEAMACRCPVVSSRTGVAADVVEPGVTGFLAEPGDAAGLATGLEAALALSDDQWRAMSNAAHARVSGYTWDDAAARLEACLAAP